MKISEKNKQLLDDFILYIMSKNRLEAVNEKFPRLVINANAEQLYKIADEYIKENHVDGVNELA